MFQAVDTYNPFARRVVAVCLGLCLLFTSIGRLSGQDHNLNAIVYNTLLGGITGGIGSLINKGKTERTSKAFLKGFGIGFGGGAVMYGGKKLNFLVARQQRLGYAWVSRAVFSAGNSIVENAAANRPFWSVWHYDLAFVRLEFNAQRLQLVPRFMPSNFGGFLFMAVHGRFDPSTSLKSGTVTFRTKRIEYYPKLIGSTASNGFLLNDTVGGGTLFYELYAHEMVHAFQFQEFSGFNHFFKPLRSNWEQQSPAFKKLSKWVYGDLNYELMLINYFIVNRGLKEGQYCRNFLENEAEYLTTGRPACK